MSIQLASFHSFLSLPTEVRSQVWQLSFPPSTNTSNIIHVHFTQNTYHDIHTKPSTRISKLNYTFKCFSPPGPHGPPIPDIRARDAYADFLRRNPRELCLSQGQRIRFNPSTDTIFMDCASLYAMGQYLLHTDPSIVKRNLKGFGAIQILGTPLSHCDREGFVSQKRNGLMRHALTGVRSFVTMRDIPGVSDEGTARRELIRDLEEQLRSLVALKGAKIGVTEEIWEMIKNIPRDVDLFFGRPDLEDRLVELEEIEEGEGEEEEEEDEKEEDLDEPRVLDRFGSIVDEREQCMEPACGFCTMQTWEERRYSIAGQR
ncbi:hypothetical protein VTL71DRAFT_1667 [Oculimacula yallundae]|uniref:2EXR domain-containing protein n=1 Tax=Oculimacula yallundae TaxID=86028 RepID=A0ABR4CBB9_9HELO